MFDSQKFINGILFFATGYLCAGIVVALFASLNFWADFLEVGAGIISFGFLVTFVVSSFLGLLLIRYLVPKYGAKAIYEQDILITMIGLLFLSLAFNDAMLIVGIIVTSGSLSVFFYENFNRQVNIARKGNIQSLKLVAWALSPIITVTLILTFNNYGLLTCRLIFAHFIIIAFWVWTRRLSLHENYADSPKFLLSTNDLVKRENVLNTSDKTLATPKEDEDKGVDNE